ncbi:MAG: HNH endonuclease [bacterium]
MDPGMDLDTQDTHATTLPDPSAPWVQKLMKLSPDDVLRAAKKVWPELRQSAWTFAFLVQRIAKEGLYRPHDSLTAWARAELGKDSGAVSKYRQSAEFVLSLEDPEERAMVMTTPPATLAEAGVPRLAKTDRAEAIRLAAAGLSQRELVQAVRVREAPDQHYDVGPLKTFRVLLTEDAHRDLLGLWHLIRFQCQTPHPTDIEIAKCLAADYVSTVQIRPDVLERFPLEDILAGRIRCADCGATNPANLERHHSHPRSLGGEESPLVTLCQPHHAAVKEDATGGGWKGHVRRWLARADMGWFHEEFDAYLDGRSLDSL